MPFVIAGHPVADGERVDLTRFRVGQWCNGKKLERCPKCGKAGSAVTLPGGKRCYSHTAIYHGFALEYADPHYVEAAA